MDSSVNKVITGGLGLGTGTAIASSIKIIEGLYVAKLLGPFNYGIWASISIIIMYHGLAHLGLLEGFILELPKLRVKNSTPNIIKLASTSFYSILIIFTLELGLILSVLHLLSIELTMSKFLPLVVLLLLSSLIASYYMFWCYAEQDFKPVAVITAISAIICLCCSIILVPKLGIIGIITSRIVMNSVIIVRLAMKRGVPKIGISIKIAWKLFKSGFPILLVGVLAIVSTSIDRILIWHFFGEQELGFYNISVVALMAVMILPTQFGRAAYPEMIKLFEISRDRQKTLALCRNLTRMLTVGTLLLITFFQFIIPILIPIVLSEYEKSISICQILLFVSVFRAVTIIYAWFLITLGLQLRVLIAQFAIVILNVLFIFLVVNFGLGLIGIAGIQVFLSLCHFVILELLVISSTKMGFWKSIVNALKDYTFTFLSLLVLMLGTSVSLYLHSINSRLAYNISWGLPLLVGIATVFYISISFKQYFSVFKLSKNFVILP